MRPRLRSALSALTGDPPVKIGMDVTLGGLDRRGFRPSSVVDIGASRGSWTRLALSHWPEASYVLVEPLSERAPELAALAAEHPNVTCVHAAAGAESGERALNVGADLDASSFLYKGVATRAVPVVTIDQLLAEGLLAPPQLMKLDVQGFEIEVLSGASEAMQSCELVLLEARFFRGRPGMPMLHELIAWMVERGWRPYELVDVLRRPLDGAMAQCDVLFAREGISLLAVEGWA